LEGWPVASIGRTDVRDFLDAIVERGAPVLANRVLSLVRKMLNFAIDVEWIDANPAQRMARPSAEQSRTRVLTADELRAVWEWLEKLAGPGGRRRHDPQAPGLESGGAQVASGDGTARRGSDCAARWQDIDLDGGGWTIPAEHAKNKMPHRVPLNGHGDQDSQRRAAGYACR
jgi:integrase